ncbi:MAG: enoyl-CoA hydratase/isomerase family protein [Rhizobiaceae bacterium]|nr:enoyl-CoA hydratase/isomerase family protein [Rhizobiaceae bacterium]
MDFGGGDEIRFERRGRAGLVTLTRPKALNALTHRMVRALAAALAAWRVDESVELVVISGEGRAFCAGGDILQVWRNGPGSRDSLAFFAEEYRLNAVLSAYPKPIVSLIDGIVMGGGFGISCHGSHRVMTEQALFAMPEVGIGFFTDVGATYLLPRLKGSFGMYLGLTGARIRAGDALHVGLATHTAASSDIPGILEALCVEGAPDAVLARFRHSIEPATDESAFHAIALQFSRRNLGDILAELQAASDRDETAAKSLAAIRKASPTSVSVVFRQIEAGAMLEFDECMRMEYRIVHAMMHGHDFFEGVRALLVDKDNAPRWQPASLDAVSDEAIESYFARPPGGDLEL